VYKLKIPNYKNYKKTTDSTTVDTCHVLRRGDAHFDAEEVELGRALGDRRVQTAPLRRTSVQQQPGAGQAAARTQLVAGARASGSAVRVTRPTHTVRAGVLEVRTDGHTVRTVLVTPARPTVLRSLTAIQQFLPNGGLEILVYTP